MDMDWDKIVRVIRERKLNGEQGLRFIEEEWESKIEEGKAELEARRADLEARRAEREARRADLEARRADREASRADLEASRAEREAKRAIALEAYAREKEELERKLRLAQATGYIGQNERRPMEISLAEVNAPDYQSFASDQQRGSEHTSCANENSRVRNEQKTKGPCVAYSDGVATVSELHASAEEGTEKENAMPPDNEEAEYSSMSIAVEGRSSKRLRVVTKERSRRNGMPQTHGSTSVKLKKVKTVLKAKKTGRNYRDAIKVAELVKGRRVKRTKKNAPKTRRVECKNLYAKRLMLVVRARHKGRTLPEEVRSKRRRVKRNRGISLSERPRHWEANRRLKKLKKTRNVKKHRFKCGEVNWWLLWC